MNNVPVFRMPEEYKNNWIITCVLRSRARVAYACGVANNVVPGGVNSTDKCEESRWVEAFDDASENWLDVNPFDPMWSSGCWPDDAAIFLGDEETEKAHKLAAEINAEA